MVLPLLCCNRGTCSHQRDEGNCPWVNCELKSLMKSKDKLKRSAVKLKSPVLMDIYRKVRNKIKSLNVWLK